MKTNSYMSACLEEASKSSLHYRHGCVIVRGGKIVGRGFNEYRPGFDGGALKTGQLAAGALDGPSLAKLKLKHKLNSKYKTDDGAVNGTFTPFEDKRLDGSGHLANVPFSLHSEMMAIKNTLSVYSASASAAMLAEKPSSNLPSHSKCKARLRREALKAYAERVCIEAEQQQQQPVPQASQRSAKFQANKDSSNHNDNEEVKELRSSAMQCGKSWKEKKKCGRKNENQHEYQSRQTTAQHLYLHGHASYCTRSRIRSTSKKPKGRPRELSGDGIDSLGAHPTTQGSPSCETAKSSKNATKKHKHPPATIEQPSQPRLVPTGLCGTRRRNVAQRTKHPRLVGADLYVARLGKPDVPQKVPAHMESSASVSPNAIEVASTLRSTAPASLHDEITPLPSLSPPYVAGSMPATDATNKSNARASHPCYRCIQYMHSVGIRRVFWTNNDGEWEGGKVRDLVDALDVNAESDAGVFVTKHEVLMLRRAMEASLR